MPASLILHPWARRVNANPACGMRNVECRATTTTLDWLGFCGRDEVGGVDPTGVLVVNGGDVLPGNVGDLFVGAGRFDHFALGKPGDAGTILGGLCSEPYALAAGVCYLEVF